MDIKELEFIRDFHDDLCTLQDQINTMRCWVEETENSTDDVKIFLDALHTQCKLFEKVLGQFKEKVDEKYWEEWQKKYPQCRNQTFKETAT